MQTLQPILLGLGLLFSSDVDLAHLREVLCDRQDPRGQSQAALLLVQSSDPGAEKLVRQGLRQPEETEVFFALTTAVRLRHDGRFLDELLLALRANRPRVRQEVAEALAVLPQPDLVTRLQAIIGDDRADLAVRQTALWVLGRSGRKAAAEALVANLATPNDALRRIAVAALTDLTGQNYGPDVARWRAWWARHKDLTTEQWLELRLSYQTSRALRLEGDLDRARSQVVRLQQLLYNRLPVAERFAHLRSLVDQEVPAVRALAVVWALELLPAAQDAPRKAQVAEVLLRLSHDGNPEVQRAAVHGLGRVYAPNAVLRLRALLGEGPPAVRAAAARSLALQAQGSDAAAKARQREVVPLLQKALDDKAVEVVVEAAEALGALGAPEACPVLTSLLRHPAEHVRQTAAQALERVANAGVLDGLLRGLDDPSVTVRFSLVGALGRAAGDGQRLTPAQRERLLARLEGLLANDADPGVRSRAATVLGECAAPPLLETLWRAAQSGTEARVREKAWGAFVEIIVRSGSLPLLQRWDRTLAEARQEARRLQLLALVAARWQTRAATRPAAAGAQEALVQAHLDAGKWAAAGPLVRELLARPGAEDGERERRLRWLLRVGELALKDGNRAEALRAAQDAQPYLSQNGPLTEGFERLEKRACRKE
jgi:HEAT repeat protein